MPAQMRTFDVEYYHIDGPPTFGRLAFNPVHIVQRLKQLIASRRSWEAETIQISARRGMKGRRWILDDDDAVDYVVMNDEMLVVDRLIPHSTSPQPDATQDDDVILVSLQGPESPKIISPSLNNPDGLSPTLDNSLPTPITPSQGDQSNAAADFVDSAPQDAQDQTQERAEDTPTDTEPVQRMDSNSSGAGSRDQKEQTPPKSTPELLRELRESRQINEVVISVPLEDFNALLHADLKARFGKLQRTIVWCPTPSSLLLTSLLLSVLNDVGTVYSLHTKTPNPPEVAESPDELHHQAMLDLFSSCDGGILFAGTDPYLKSSVDMVIFMGLPSGVKYAERLQYLSDGGTALTIVCTLDTNLLSSLLPAPIPPSANLLSLFRASAVRVSAVLLKVPLKDRRAPTYIGLFEHYLRNTQGETSDVIHAMREYLYKGLAWAGEPPKLPEEIIREFKLEGHLASLNSTSSAQSSWRSLPWK